ncbi:DNA polymerase III subunit epsilon [Thalassoglobus neptunius]|uniref:DNA polymerase III subunit epsilon n=1 Tax=Thalassoglobus neptunius TaxID=1938619 RepID=A0A5C5VS56_9PLAN|nr:hypothetical protein [Thalassoglobus neptunius]TWT41466.1 DNA polymerase III subunit epsilon [Thalassoglobus neptunius]
MLKREYSRLHAELEPGRGFCTLRATGLKLSTACQNFGIDLSGGHRALIDARATAQLLKQVFDEDSQCEPARVENLTFPLNPRTLRRESCEAYRQAPLHRLIANSPYPTSDWKLLSYLDALDWVLDDLVVTEDEKLHLAQLAKEYSLSGRDVADLHHRYLASIIQAAWRDNVITEDEHALIKKVADLLDVNDFEIPRVTAKCSTDGAIKLGARVCFTGSATDSAGNKISRDDLEMFAAKMGLNPIKSVSKKGCDLVVAADPSTNSGKAKKARGFGIPIISIQDFLSEVRSESAKDK